MFRRKPPPPPPTPEAARIAHVRASMERVGADAHALDTVDTVDAAVAQALGDRERLDASIAALDPERAASELKEALRNRPSPDAPDTPVIESLRRRYESINGLINRRDGLLDQIERTLVDLETLAAEVAVTAAGGGRGGLDAGLRQVGADAAALAAAHRELDGL